MTIETEKEIAENNITATQAYDASVMLYKSIVNDTLNSTYSTIRLRSEAGYFHAEVEVEHGEPYIKLIIEQLKKDGFRASISNDSKNFIIVSWSHLDVSSSPV